MAASGPQGGAPLFYPPTSYIRLLTGSQNGWGPIIRTRALESGIQRMDLKKNFNDCSRKQRPRQRKRLNIDSAFILGLWCENWEAQDYSGGSRHPTASFEAGSQREVFLVYRTGFFFDSPHLWYPELGIRQYDSPHLWHPNLATGNTTLRTSGTPNSAYATARGRQRKNGDSRRSSGCTMSMAGCLQDVTESPSEYSPCDTTMWSL
ncbi:uncharacterized protein LOC142489230 [Ascaphus truei]|uniref:uncharacterized protein LOC142489230 n=1 Tax=Ascaphus truei TaxID=8439 RepID=UPI003F59B3AA